MREIVPSHHCVVRFRQRRPVSERGAAAVADALVAALERVAVRGNPLLLQRTDRPGRWLAVTCLTR